MVIKKIKKSSVTMMSIIITILLFMAGFFVIFSYTKTQTDAAGITIDQRYNETYGNLSKAQVDLKERADAIQSNAENISEASDAYQVAWNGLKGLGNTLRLMLGFTSSASETSEAIFVSLDIIPSIIKVLITTGLIILLVFVVISIFKGDPNLI
jgi:hypothetical protein